MSLEPRRSSTFLYVASATGEGMFSLMEHTNRSSDSLVVLSGVAALLDTVVGGMINLGLDLSRPHELVFGISLVLGLPTFLLDLKLKKQFAYFLSALFLFHWAALCFSGPVPVFTSPFSWPVGILLFIALASLQWSKLRARPAQ